MAAIALLDQIKYQAGRLAHIGGIYPERIPDRLNVRPVDPWRGDAEKGASLCTAAGASEQDGPVWFEQWWEPEDADAVWLDHMHGFQWLRDLRMMGGALARAQGRLMIQNWIETYPNPDKTAWQSDLTGQRLSMWISHYEYFCAGADEYFEDLFFASLIRQARHLQASLGSVREVKSLQAIKGLIYAGVALEGHAHWVSQGLRALEKDLARQILTDGGHISRSPEKLLEALQASLDIQAALAAGDADVPCFLRDSIMRMATAVRFFRYGDRKFGVFHGAQEGSASEIDTVLAQAGARGRIPQSLPCTGFERMSLGRSLVMLDTGRAPEYPFDADAHASPLGFEFCYGKERVLVSCGAHPTSAPWNAALRSTAAHNTACIDQRDACEIRKDGHFGRKVTRMALDRQESAEAILVEAAHNGYMPLNGILHTRKLYLGDEGNDLRGEDDFASAAPLVRSVEIALRFHLHPDVSVSLINNNTEALLRIPGGVGWRFHFGHGALLLEDSIYLGSGITPRKTKQLVIYGQMSGEFSCVKWSLKREG
ncbi:MAG: heparinase II/III family protein [Alphaproteobacteria bacterium]|nr:heparinase II/III family protein [Alphaproteobacteria bacterium]